MNYMNYCFYWVFLKDVPGKEFIRVVYLFKKTQTVWLQIFLQINNSFILHTKLTNVTDISRVKIFR